MDQITKTGSYHYNPGFYHGPLHFYILFVAQILFGRHAWAIRLPVALFSTGCVALTLAFRRYLPDRTCQVAAAAMAFSPGMIYYGRDGIHETEQVFFLLLALWGGAGLFHKKRPPAAIHAWSLVIALAGLVLTKETYAIHWIAFLLAFPALLLLERFSPSDGPAWGAPSWPKEANRAGLAACFVGLIVFFYSGGLLDWPSLGGVFQALTRWGSVGFATEDHQKHYGYWLELIWAYEWPALAGMVAAAWLAARNSDRFIRYIAIMGAGVLAGYTLIPYKTPWCAISIIWPFYFVASHFLTGNKSPRSAWIAAGILTAAFAQSTITAMQLNFRDYADENEPDKRMFPSAAVARFIREKLSKSSEEMDPTYVYVQTTNHVEALLRPLRWLTTRDAANYHIPGHILIHSGESEPLPWVLGDFTAIDFLDDEHPPQQMDADFLLVDDSIVSDTEERLKESYFKESFLLRGQSGLFVTLYLRSTVFTDFFPGREPEFVPPKENADPSAGIGSQSAPGSTTPGAPDKAASSDPF